MNFTACVRVSLTSVILACGLAGASAQSAPQQIDPKACAPSERLQQGSNAPNAPATQSTTGEDLSNKLARTDGIICPPNVDADIKAPTPQTGKMPVIPPPGSPGGDQSVQPK